MFSDKSILWIWFKSKQVSHHTAIYYNGTLTLSRRTDRFCINRRINCINHHRVVLRTYFLTVIKPFFKCNHNTVKDWFDRKTEFGIYQTFAMFGWSMQSNDMYCYTCLTSSTLNWMHIYFYTELRCCQS